MNFKSKVEKLSDDDLKSIVGKLQEVDTIVSPIAINMNKDEKKRAYKMGQKSYGFVEITLNHARANQQLLPNYQDINSLISTMEFVKQLQEIMVIEESLHEKLKDTLVAMGTEAFLSARVFYDSVKAAAKQGVPGCDVIVKELGTIFKKGKKTTTTTLTSNGTGEKNADKSLAHTGADN